MSAFSIKNFVKKDFAAKAMLLLGEAPWAFFCAFVVVE